MIYENNGMFYKETLPGNNPVNLSIDAALQWTPIKYITLFGSVFACYNEFYTASNGKTTGWWGSQTLGARINVWEMQAEFMCFDPFSNYLTKYCEGDISYRGTPGYRAALEWTHKSFKIGVNWLRQNRTTIVGSIPNMRLSETNYWKEQNNTVMIVFDYRFRYGDSKQRNIQKKLNNADTDTGLTEDMKAK
jgi:hypothetical protein